MAKDAQRLAAFRTFDLDGSGLITVHDLPFAFQACEDINQMMSDEDTFAAMRRAGLDPLQPITFDGFSRTCDIVEEILRPQRQARQLASNIVAQDIALELREVTSSPRRTTRSVPPATWDNRAEDHEYLAGPVASVPPEGLPMSPTGPKACLSDIQGIDPVAHAFYTFDVDFTGAVSACELPRMLRLVPRRDGRTLGRPEKGGESGAKKWDDKVANILADIGKGWGDLINIHDFQEIIDNMDPPPAPEPPPKPDEPGGGRDKTPSPTPSELARQAEEEERKRRLEEAQRSWEAMMRGTLVVKFEDGRFAKVLCCEAGDKVSQVMERISEQEIGWPWSGCKERGLRVEEHMRLVGRGFDMDHRKKLSDYGVKVGAPWGMLPATSPGKNGSPGPPFSWDNGDIVICIVKAPPPALLQYVPVSGLLQLHLWDGTAAQTMAEEDEPLDHIMRRLMEEIGRGPTMQRWVVHGREMNARKTLRDHSVTFVDGRSDSVIDVMLREVPAEPGYRPNLPASTYASPARW